MRALDKGFYKLRVGSVALLIGAAGSGKSTFLSHLLTNLPKFAELSQLKKPTRLVFSPGAARELPAAEKCVFFDVVQLEPNLPEKLGAVRASLKVYGLNVIVIEDFFLFSSATFSELVHIFFQNLRHDNILLILTMQSISHQKNFNLLLGYVSKIFLHTSASNLPVIQRLSQKFGYSVSVREALTTRLRDMQKIKSESNTYDCMLLDTERQLAVCNFQTRPLTSIKKRVAELNTVIDTSGMSDEDLEYLLVPKKKLQLVGDEQGSSASDLISLFPKQKREEALSILEILRRAELLKFVDRKTLMFCPGGTCSCGIYDLVCVLGGFAKFCPPSVKEVVAFLKEKKIGLPQVSVHIMWGKLYINASSSFQTNTNSEKRRKIETPTEPDNFSFSWE